MKRSSIFCLFIVFYFAGNSQQTTISHKFGKVSARDFDAKYCPIDSTAHAYYIFDEGKSYLYDLGGLKILTTRHYRIHILDKAGKAYGNIALPVYVEDNSHKEQVTYLKATTYNLLNGRIIQNKIDTKNLKLTQSADKWYQYDIAMPGVKPGAIIELEYNLVSDFWYNLPEWTFQHDIPVLESECITSIPYDYKFIPHIWGEQKIAHAKANNFNDETEAANGVTHFYTTDVPAFNPLPYVLNKTDLRSRVEFELVSATGEDGIKIFAHTWRELSKQLMADENFGKQLFNNTFLMDVANKLTASDTSVLNKIKAAYQYIHNNMQWNGAYGVYPSIDIQKAYDKRAGNIADINLLLLKLFKVLEVPAAPVLLSTAGNGRLRQDYPTLSKANYLIIAVPLDTNRLILLDAADPYATFEMIPPKCLNGQGLLLNDAGGIWVDLKSNKLGQVRADYKFKLNSEYVWEGTYMEHDYRYFAYKLREQIKDSTQLQDFVNFLHDEYGDIRLSEPDIDYVVNENDREIIIKANIRSRMGFTRTTDSLLFAPIQLERIISNPFNIESRSVPVEYAYPAMTNATVIFDIPDGFKVEKIPSSVTYQNAAKTIKFTYLIQNINETTLIAKSLLILNQTVFTAEEYPDLRAFFDLVVKKQAEQVVFKKKV